MADESVDSVLTPAKHEDGVHVRKSPAHRSVSPRASYHAGESSAKNSTENSGSANRKNVVPRYLRAPTSSCHDFCKHGKQHSFEEKARKPLPKKIATTLSNQHPVLIMVSGEKKEKVFDQISPKHSPDLNPSPEIISHSPKPEKSLNKKKVVKEEPLIDTKKNHLRKPESTSSSGNKPVLLKSKPSSTKKCPSPEPPEIVKSVFFPSKKDEDPVKRASLADNKMPKGEKKLTFPSKKSSSSPVKLKPLEAKPFSSSSLDNSDSTHGKERKNIVSSMAPNMPISKASTKKVSAPPKLPITRTVNSNSRTSGNVIIRSVDKTKTPDNEKVPEKILQVIRTESNNDKVSAPPKLPITRTANSNSRTSGNVIIRSVDKTKTPLPITRTTNSNSRTSGNVIIRSVDKTKTPDNEKVPEKILQVTQTKSNNDKISAPPKLPITRTANSNSRTSVNVIIRSVDKTKTPFPITRTANSNSRTSGNVIMRSVDKTKTPDSEKVPEKILHVIQTESNNDAIVPVSSLPAPPSVTSPPHDNSSLFSSRKESNEVTGHSKGTEANENIVPEQKITLIKTKVVISKDKKIHPPVKLKFRNGKVLEVHSNSYSPRILRFTKARVIGSDEGRSDHWRRRIFKKRVVNIDDKTGEGTFSEKIVLKRQEVNRGKKDGQGLLNNVIIEQTASKLVKSRKSKVKALVGAFEIVISLQKSRPSSQAVG